MTFICYTKNTNVIFVRSFYVQLLDYIRVHIPILVASKHLIAFNIVVVYPY